MKKRLFVDADSLFNSTRTSHGRHMTLAALSRNMKPLTAQHAMLCENQSIAQF